MEAADLEEQDDPRGSAYVQTIEEYNANREAEQKEEAWLDAERKRKGKAIAINNKEMTEDPDFMIDTETLELALNQPEEDITPEKKSLKKKPTIQKTPPGTKDGKITDLFTYFMSLEFTATIYPDEEALEALGILNDVKLLFKCIELEDYMTMRFPTFKKAAAEFLATVKVQELQGEKMMTDHGGGIVTFDYKGKGESTDLRKISEYFGFVPGQTKLPNVSKEDMARMWRLISSEPALPTTPRGAVIRNPAVNYARQAIAKAFFARKVTSSVSNQDLQFMTMIIHQLFEYNKSEMEGDLAKSGRAYVLCKYIEGFRKRAAIVVQKNQSMDTFTLGGIITGILKCAGLDPEADGMKMIKEETMDLNWMYKKGMLIGPRSESEFYYKFMIKDGTSVAFKLPNRKYTEVNGMSNTRFRIPEDLILDPKTVAPTKNSPPKHKEAGPSQKKQKLAPGEPKHADTCLCNQPGFIDKLVADLTPRLMEKMSREFVKKHQQPRLPVNQAGREAPTRSPSQGTSRNPTLNRPPSRTPQTGDHQPPRKSGPIVRLNNQRPPAHKRA